MPRFYRPERARLGDTIPFFWNGVFHIFYLKRYADDTHDRTETDWWHVSTTDFVRFEEVGVAVKRGAVEDPDHSVATGSVVRVGDEFQAYYTGFREWQAQNGGRHQTVLRARSTDLVSWEKDPGFRLVADESRHDPHEWRDPFVYWDDDAKSYRMLVAARSASGPALRRGLTAQASSEDGESWAIDADPFWEPRIYSMHECPDYFRLGDYWYLVYSTPTDRTVTRYRMSTSPRGPWVSPTDDALDGLGLYAAKTISDGERRYLVGWCPNSAAGRDGAAWLWGGNLVVHELAAGPAGELLVRRPEISRHALEELQDATSEPTAAIVVDAPAGYASAKIATMPYAGLVDLTLTPAPGTKAFGLELRTDADRRVGYSVTIEPELCRATIDRIDRFGADSPYDIRSFDFTGPDLEVALDFDGEIYVLYLDGRVAITLRGYDLSGDTLAAFAIEGGLQVQSGSICSVQLKVEEDR